MDSYCYLVQQTEEYEDGVLTVAVFRDKEKADKYTEIQQALNPYSGFYVSKKEYLDESFDESVKVSYFYNYDIYFDVPFNLEDMDEENSFCQQEAEPQIWKTDNYVLVTDDFLTGYSVESYDKAREIALDCYEKIKQNKNNETLYNIIDKREGKEIS
jgi:hypothetical protein